MPSSKKKKVCKKPEVESIVLTTNAIETPPNAVLLPGSSAGIDRTAPLAVLVSPVSKSSSIYSGEGFLDANEVKDWRNWCEQLDFEEINSKGDREYAMRIHGRWSKIDTSCAHSIFRRVSPILEWCSLARIGREKAVGCHPNIRIYRYRQGEAFGRHIDESNKVDGMGTTLVTVLIYLSECKGGCTTFYTGHFSSAVAAKVTPTAGLILLHRHGEKCLTHEAQPVLEGVKYILRTDVVFSAVEF
jgi:hypothetical protein